MRKKDPPRSSGDTEETNVIASLVRHVYNIQQRSYVLVLGRAITSVTKRRAPLNVSGRFHRRKRILVDVAPLGTRRRITIARRIAAKPHLHTPLFNFAYAKDSVLKCSIQSFQQQVVDCFLCLAYIQGLSSARTFLNSQKVHRRIRDHSLTILGRKIIVDDVTDVSVYIDTDY